MTVFTKLAVASVVGADYYFTDPSKIDKNARTEFGNIFERSFCAGNQSAPCSEEGPKVCANDGWTYSSPCDFRRNYCMGNRSLRFHHWGQCGEINDFVDDFVVIPEKKKCNEMCTRELRLACGSDGKTYSNMCLLNLATCQSDGEVEFVHYGECEKENPEYEEEPEQLDSRQISKCDAECPSREYNPICGSDNKTYSSLCGFQCAVQEYGITLKHRGACREMANDFSANRFMGRFPVPSSSCKKCYTREIRYVCGTNGKTYDTECALDYDRCYNKVDVELDGYGPCENDRQSLMLDDFMNDFIEEEAEEIETCENIRCTNEKEPVCGEFREVIIPYINKCYMKIFSCKLAGNLYSIKSRGKPKRNSCKQHRSKRSEESCSSNMGCHRMLGGISHKGVCGSDGVTYSNECELERANCDSDDVIELSYRDRCDSECATNPMGIDFQCGTNGLTYLNMCSISEFNYLNRLTDPFAESVSVAKPGLCATVSDVQMLDDFPADDLFQEEKEEEEEYEYDEEEENLENPYSSLNCRLRKESNKMNPCNTFEFKNCYSNGEKYSLCQFRLAKCDDPTLVLAIDPESCDKIRGW